MPTKYIRKSALRGNWSESNLLEAIAQVQDGKMKLREAARHFKIPHSTLSRRIIKNDNKKHALGPSCTLGEENEVKIVRHIRKLQRNGFAPSRDIVRTMAFNLAEQLGIPHKFDRQSGMAGYQWLTSFLRRNSQLSVRKSESVSINRSQGMNKEDVRNYFEILERVLIDNNLLDKPGHIFNVDETGVQLNNKAGQVIAEKGSKNVAAISSGEKGETISVIACCNAEGLFIPPTCILKGKIKKPEFEEGMPPGSVVMMSQKSAYVTADIFYDWLKKQFVPRKPAGPVVLLLDGHSSHANVEMLEYAAEQDIILVCLPSHTTQFLQPLDRAFFKPFKSFYYEECNIFIRHNPGRKITRLVFGKLLSKAWNKSATIGNAVSAFKATGIVPYDPSAIPDYAFLCSENDFDSTSNLRLKFNKRFTYQNFFVVNFLYRDIPSTSAMLKDSTPLSHSYNGSPSTSTGICETNIVENAPTILDVVHPIPHQEKLKTTRRQLACVLTSLESITAKKRRTVKKPVVHKRRPKPFSSENSLSAVLKDSTTVLHSYKDIPSTSTAIPESNIVENSPTILHVLNPTSHQQTPKTTRRLRRGIVKKTAVKKRRTDLSSSESSTTSLHLDDNDNDSEPEFDDNKCIGCGEDYNQTRKTEDWLQCVVCKFWYHEFCSKYANTCESCAKTST